MRGYLTKVYSSFIGMSILIAVAYRLTSVCVKLYHPEQRQFYVMANLTTLLIAALGSLVIIYLLARPIAEGVDAPERLSDEDLARLTKRNQKMPTYCMALLALTYTIFQTQQLLLNLITGVGAFTTFTGLVLQYFATVLVLPLVLRFMVSSIANRAFAVLYQEHQRRGLACHCSDLALSYQINLTFLLLVLGSIFWISGNSVGNTLDTARSQAHEKIQALQALALSSQDVQPGAVATWKPLIDKLNTAAGSMLVNRQGRIIYNPANIPLFNTRWGDVNRAIKTGLEGSSSGMVFDNVLDQVVSFTPVDDQYRIVSTYPIDKAAGSLKRMMGSTVPVLVIALIAAYIAIRGLRATIIRPTLNLLDRLRDLSAGEGDLTKRLDVTNASEIGKLAENTNVFVTKLEGIIAGVKDSTHQVTSATNEVASGAGSLADASQNQASSIEEISATIQGIATSIKEAAANSSRGRDLSAAIAQSVDNGLTTATEMSASMREISESSAKIRNIVTTVNEVAFQTNLLALNAAVEAARAGEQGKGFAVVAEEVRSLAQRSAASATEIRQLIDDITDKVSTGNARTDKVTTSMQEINGQMSEFANTMHAIAEASQAQALGIDEINQAVEHIDRAIQQNTATVEELASVSSTLEQEAADLLRKVEIFKVSGD